MKLRTQILLISLVLLIGLPLVAWQSVRMLEAQLRDQQAQVLVNAARAAADTITGLPSPGDSLYVHSTERQFLLDGYPEEWRQWQDQALTWSAEDGAHAVQFLAARNHQGLHLLFQVDDPTPVFATMGPEGVSPGDHVRLSFEDAMGRRDVVISSFAPGQVEAASGPDPDDIRVQGQWQSRRGGWTLELQVLSRTVPKRLGFSIAQVSDESAREPIGLLGPSRPLPLTSPSSQLHAELMTLTGVGLRTWLIDRRGFVLAHADRQQVLADTPEDVSRLATLFYEHLVSNTLPVAPHRGDEADQLHGPDIDQALAGDTLAWWHTVRERPGITVSTAAPVTRDETIVGAVVIEQAGNATLLLANRALLTFFALTLAVFGLAVLVLLVFATYFTVRIRRLRNAAEQAVDNDGRVRASIEVSGPRDEIGDLRRSTAALLNRQREQQDYLRTLADKLAHELRTPLATIRTSLENLNQADSFAEAGKYRTRAKEGMNRLSRILNAMGQASRLEQSLESDRPETVDLAGLVGDYVAGCRELHPERSFGLEIRTRPKPIQGSPELIAQLLDKLTENAVDFSSPGGTIHYRLQGQGNGAVLEVENPGPPLPEAMRGQLFESMVSVREKHSDDVHLGLGLYVARLIAEHHGGTITARNSDGGVVFSVSFRAPLG